MRAAVASALLASGVNSSTQYYNGAASVTSSKHPAILNFPAQADRISALMRSNEDFSGICRDYAQVVGDITRQERTPDHGSAVLAELLRLRSDLERDIVDHLSEAEVESHEGP